MNITLFPFLFACIHIKFHTPVGFWNQSAKYLVPDSNIIYKNEQDGYDYFPEVNHLMVLIGKKKIVERTITNIA